MPILLYFYLIFAHGNSSINVNSLIMIKISKFVLNVLPLLKRGRYSVVLDGEVWSGSKQFIFDLVGSGCVALQLLIPFEFV